MAWRQLYPADSQYCDEFVRLMKSMDPRYCGLTSKQLQLWLDTNNPANPYANNAAIEAYAWFPDSGQTSDPKQMQMVFMGRYEKAGDTSADFMMLGWAPMESLYPSLFDDAVEVLLEKCTSWLHSLSPGCKNITAIRPLVTRSQRMQILLDTIFDWATADPPPPGHGYLRMAQLRPLSDAQYWMLKLIP